MGRTTAEQAEKEGVAGAPWVEVHKKPVLDPGVLYEAALRNGSPTDWYGQVNSIEIARGYKPGKATLLMLRRDAEKLPKDELITITWHDGEKKIEFHGWTVVRFYSILPVLDSEKEAPVVVELADVRAIVNKRINSIGAGQAVDPVGEFFLNSGGYAYPRSWKNLCEALGRNWQSSLWMNDKIIEGGKDFAREIQYPPFPDSVPQAVQVSYIPGWLIWCAALRFNTMDVVVDPFDRKFRVIDVGKDYEEEKRREPLIYDFGDAEGFATRPAAIHVVFTRYGRQSDGQGNVEVVRPENPGPFGGWWYGWWYGWGNVWSSWFGAWYSGALVHATTSYSIEEKDLPALKGGMGRVTIYDSTGVDFTKEDGFDIIVIDDEQKELTRKRAKSLAERWLKRHVRSVHASQRHYSGIIKMLPNPAVGRIVWRDYGDGQGAVTELHYGEQPDPNRPYLIEAGIIGRGIWQVAPTEEHPKLSFSFERFPRVSNVHFSGDIESGENLEPLTTGSGDTQAGFDTGGAGLPAVYYSNDPDTDLLSPASRLYVQENGSYQIQLHGMLGVSENDPNLGEHQNGLLLAVTATVFTRFTAGGTIGERVALRLTRKHFQIESDSEYNLEGFVSAENVSGSVVVPLRAGDYLEVRNESDSGSVYAPVVSFTNGIMVVTREDFTQ